MLPRVPGGEAAGGEVPVLQALPLCLPQALPRGPGLALGALGDHTRVTPSLAHSSYCFLSDCHCCVYKIWIEIEHSLDS